MSTIRVFIDTSGSTGGRFPYWNYVRNLVSQSRLKDAKFYTYDSSARQVSLQVILAIAQQLGDGDRGTYTSTIATLVKKDDALVIVTDGQVEPEEVKRCDTLLQNMAFKSVEVHFQYTCGAMDLSVSAPFTRNTPACRLLINGVEAASGNTAEKIDLSSYYHKPTKFLDDVDSLRARVVLLTTGRRNEELRNALLDLQKNLMAHIAAQGENAFEPLRAALATDYDQSLTLIATIIKSVDKTTGTRVADAITILLRIADGKDYSFANLVPSRMTRATNVAPAPIAELPAEERVGDFSCPITLDDDIPLCFIARGNAILADVEKSKLEDLMTNPLLFLLDPVLVTRLIERIDHLVGFQATKELFARSSTIISPFTRRSISSALTFGLGKEHVKATNVALADLFFGNKLVGQPELWLAVVYFVVTKEIPYLAEQTGFIKAFQVHLTHRMRNAKTNMTLSGLPIEPLIKAPVDIAVWYCVVSTFLAGATAMGYPVSDININFQPTTNRLRDFGATGKYLLELVDLLGYKYKREDTLKLMSFYKAFAWMMNQEKTPGSQWRAKLRAQYQNSVMIDDRIVFLDGPATEETRPRLPDFAILPGGRAPYMIELVALADLVDKKKATSDVHVPLYLLLMPPRYYYHYTYDKLDRFLPELSPATFRPVVIDRASRKHWKECSEARYGDLKKQISLYNYFIKFVQEKGRYPESQGEYIIYTADKQAAREDGGAVDTLPEYMIAFVAQLFANYEKILGEGFKNVPASEFKRVTYASMREVDRKRMDGSESV